MSRSPLHTISEMAVVLGIAKHTLIWRINNSGEKPTPRGDLLNRNLIFGRYPGKTANTARYYKDEFIDWHKRNWLDTGRAMVCKSNSAGKGGE